MDNRMRAVVQELIAASSSSSSEEEVEENEPVLNQLLVKVYQQRQKNELFLENVVPNYTEGVFREHSKVGRESLSDLAIKFRSSEWYPKKETGFERLSPEHSLWIFCWFASHEAAGFRDVADRFNIYTSTLHLLIFNVSHFISNISPTVIKWPTEVEQEEISRDFVEMGFVEGVIGCVDGVHFKIDKPTNDAESYYNRKKYFSLQMQAVCDSRRSIRDVFIGYPGSVHDARVFRNSELNQTLAMKCGSKFILGDTAYPCFRNLITPYKDFGNLTEAQTYFNQKLSHCRVRIEHTFGILKQKFRYLYHIKLRDIDTICHFIRACCVLHNLSLIDADDFEIEDIINEPAEGIPNENVEHNAVGDNFRNYLAIFLYENRNVQ